MFLKNKNKKINLNDERGFTIMETLVAIFILLISITGPMVFSQNGLRAAFQSRDQITAFYLAQDAIEFIKNRRDHNVLEPNSVGFGWLDGLEDCIAEDLGDFGCTINTSLVDGNIVACNGFGSDPGCLGNNEDGSQDNKLRINSDGYFINTLAGSVEESTFARNIYIRETEAGREAEIVVKVRWTSHDTIGVRDVTVVEYIYNWANLLGL